LSVATALTATSIISWYLTGPLAATLIGTGSLKLAITHKQAFESIMTVLNELEKTLQNVSYLKIQITTAKGCLSKIQLLIQKGVGDIEVTIMNLELVSNVILQIKRNNDILKKNCRTSCRL